MAYKEGRDPVADPVKVAPRVKMFAEVVGRGKPMVLVHGFGLDHRMWKYQIPYLKNNGYHVVSIDLRGFGDSKNMPASYTYDTWANDLGKAIDKFERRNVTLVGYSLGGAIAMHYMATHDDPPVKRLALVAAAGPYMTWSREDVLERLASYSGDLIGGAVEAAWSFFTGHWANIFNVAFRTGAVLAKQMFLDVDNILDHPACFGRDAIFFNAFIDLINSGAFPELIPQIYGDGVPRAEADAQWIEDMFQSSSPAALVGGIEEVRDQDLQDSLEEIDVPTTIVGGMADFFVPPWLIAEQLMLIKGAECSMLPGGHGLFFEQIDALNRVLAGK
ncbi:MAG: alpha/beta fold hydrolase [Halobacteriota archaeon]